MRDWTIIVLGLGALIVAGIAAYNRQTGTAVTIVALVGWFTLKLYGERR